MSPIEEEVIESKALDLKHQALFFSENLHVRVPLARDLPVD
jgi:hypothetical protein